MVTGRHSADAALLADGRVLVAGGAGATDAAIGSAELYSPVSRAARQLDGSCEHGGSARRLHR